MNFRIIPSDELVDGKLSVLQLGEISAESYSRLLTPKLKVIGFEYTKESCKLTIWVKEPENLELFSSWAVELKQKLDGKFAENERIEIFNSKVRQLIILGRKEVSLSKQKVMGLYGELSALKDLLVASENHEYTLEGWNRPHPAIHDFDYTDYAMEIKAVGRSKTTIGISSEYQLQPGEKRLLLKVIKLDVHPKSGVDSLGELYTTISRLVGKGLAKRFEEKCASDSFASYLGPEHERAEYAITVLSEDDYVVKHDFPRVKDFPAGISNIRYDLDISALEEFKINSNG